MMHIWQGRSGAPRCPGRLASSGIFILLLVRAREKEGWFLSRTHANESRCVRRGQRRPRWAVASSAERNLILRIIDFISIYVKGSGIAGRRKRDETFTGIYESSRKKQEPPRWQRTKSVDNFRIRFRSTLIACRSSNCGDSRRTARGICTPPRREKPHRGNPDVGVAPEICDMTKRWVVPLGSRVRNGCSV